MRTFEEVVAFAERQINLQMGAVSIIREDAQTLLSTIRDRDKTIAELREHIQIVESDNADLRKVYAGEVRTSNTLRVLLKRLEWFDDGYEPEAYCPICRNYKRVGHHDPDCELAQAIGGDA
ncbi:MAG: hypothetical protein M0Z85_08100 [Gammaproteobacteria bacterium]|nr:hypothetical protein [Gammaproteobacteria bacterium]